MQAYNELVKRFTRMYRFNHVSSIVMWDTMVNMPPKGAEARGAAEAEMKVLLHDLITDEAIGPLLKEAAAADLSAEQKANLREMRRAWEKETQLPASLVERKSVAMSKAQAGWRMMRAANDWDGFKPLLQEVIDVTREVADLLSKSSGLKKYDALMDQYEPGATMAQLDVVFADIKSWLPSLIKEVRAQNAGVSIIEPKGPFPVDKQKALGVEIMKDLGFDFDSGRLDISSHPFCGGVSEDVRLTTRYYEDKFDQSLMGIIHETGHSRYEQNRPRELITQPVSQARSMGIHESQSLFHEMQLARSTAFMTYLSPLICKHLGDQEAFSPENLTKLYRRVEPGLIRVDADELCYPLHVILRYEIERALIEDNLPIDDIPKLWDAKMMEYLGLDTTGNYKDGCMQDIHWSVGYVGYFPTYTLGAMYAAQLMAAVQRELTPATVAEKTASGEFAPMTDWLKTKIWSRGSIDLTDDLITAATGETLNVKHYREHLTTRYKSV